MVLVSKCILPCIAGNIKKLSRKIVKSSSEAELQRNSVISCTLKFLPFAMLMRQQSSEFCSKQLHFCSFNKRCVKVATRWRQCPSVLSQLRSRGCQPITTSVGGGVTDNSPNVMKITLILFRNGKPHSANLSNATVRVSSDLQKNPTKLRQYLPHSKLKPQKQFLISTSKLVIVTYFGHF